MSTNRVLASALVSSEDWELAEEGHKATSLIVKLRRSMHEEQPKPRWNFDADKPRTIHKP
jgi:hypothetical protein